MTRRWSAPLLSLCLMLAAGWVTAAPAGTGPGVLTVVAAGGATRTALHLQAGFATVLRADRRIDTVAIGDPRLVTATVVKRGQDAQDLVLQPQTETGATNMVVWFGTLTTVWELDIGPGRRTADIVYVTTGSGVTTAPGAATAAPAASAGPGVPAAPPASTTPAPSPGPVTGHAEGGQPGNAQPQPSASGSGSPAASAGPSFLETRQTEGNVSAVFRALRAADGVFIRYRITNGSDGDLTLRPGGVLVRVDGRLVPYGMARESVDRGRPDILPRGATETGVIDAPAQTARRVQLILSLFPAAPDGQAPGDRLPFTFQATFAGVDLLAISTER